MGLVYTSPFVPAKGWRRDAQTSRGVRPIASSGTRLGCSMHGCTSWTCTERKRMSYVCTAPQSPAETLSKPAKTNTSHTDKILWKNLAGAFTLLQGFGVYTHKCASAPPRNSTTTRQEESPISNRQPLRVPNGYHCR
jgi:hypothetical protein